MQSCFKIETYPVEPSVKTIGFTLVDSMDLLGNPILNGTLHFSFIDGDGDIGFDTVAPQQNTIFIEKYKIVNGISQLVNLSPPLYYYVPKFTSEGNNRALKGEMFVRDLNEYQPFDGDTIMYKFYIVDRAGHVSNIDSTEYLIIE